MTKFVSKENLETVVGTVKTKLDSKITDPGNGTKGQVLVKTETGTEWATPEEVDQCECEELTEPEMDLVMGIISENDFAINIGGLNASGESNNSYSIPANGSSYTIALVDESDSGKYAITKVTPSESWVTVDAKFAKLTVASRGTEVGEERSCNVDIEVNNMFNKTLVITQGENKETLSAPNKVNISKECLQVGENWVYPDEIGKCVVNATYSSGAIQKYEFDPMDPERYEGDPTFEYKTTDGHKGETFNESGIEVAPLDRTDFIWHSFQIVMKWAEKNFEHTYNLEISQYGEDQFVE